MRDSDTFLTGAWVRIGSAAIVGMLTVFVSMIILFDPVPAWIDLVNVARARYELPRATQRWLCKEMDDKVVTGFTLLGLGLVDLAEDKPEASENLLRSLYLRYETSEPVAQTSSLIGIAGLVFREGNPHFAAQLLGAVESALKTLNAAVAEEVRLFHAQTQATVREQLGESAFQSAWEDGAKWSLAEAVAIAFEEYQFHD